MAELEPGAVAPAVTENAPVANTVPAPDAPAGQDQATPPEGDKPPVKVLTEDEHRAAVAKAVNERLTKERKRLERTVRAELERDFYKSQLEQQQQPPKAQADGKPQPKDFADFESWEEAMIEWKLEQRLAKEKERSARETAEQRRHREAAEYYGQLKESVLKGAEKYADFHEVVSESDATITETMAIAIAESGIGADLSYYLCKNEQEAARIAKLPASLQAHEVHKLVGKLTAAPKTTSAPPPIEPNSGNAVPKGGYRPDMSDKEFNEWRRRSLAQKR